MAQNDKVRDLLLKDVEEEIHMFQRNSQIQSTHVSARMNLILLFEYTTSNSISGLLSKERRITALANPEMSRTVMQLQ